MIKQLLITLIFITSGCATILQPGPDKIMVSSEPTGATIRLDGIPVGKTPAMVSVNRDAEAVFTLDHNGYDSVTIDRNKVVAGWVIGNVIVGGVIGLTVDLICHNQGKYSEEPIYVQLNPATNKAKNSCKISNSCIVFK